MKNLLFSGGEAYYLGPVMPKELSQSYFEKLLEEVYWQQDEVMIFGKKITTSRKTAWYADKAFEYTYSKMTKTARLWIPELLELKSIVEQKTGLSFNSCLLNLYHSGEEGMGWHSDAEAELGSQPDIASLSLGAERRFVLRHKETREKAEILLEKGSLLLMRGETQRFWQHSLPKTKKVKEARINLTFRNIRIFKR